MVNFCHKNGNDTSIIRGVKTALVVEDYHSYLKTQSMAVLKQVASQYPYESTTGHSLKAEAVEVGQDMVKLLQTKVDAAGMAR
jgi:hypothetical protein